MINISKFFEVYVSPPTEEIVNYQLKISPLRKNATYSTITNWMRLIFMSALPLLIIVFFNFKVYNDVKERSQRSYERKSLKVVNNSTTKVKQIKVSAHSL